jgi:hypothetical protein
MSSATGLARLRRNVGTARVSVRKRWAPVAAEEGDGDDVSAPAAAPAAVAVSAPAPLEIAAELRTAVDALGARPGEVVADALRLFLTRYAAAEKLPLGRVLYCFVLRLVMQLDEWRAEAEQIAHAAPKAKARGLGTDLAHPSLGVLAAELGAYPALAHHLMEGSPDAEPDGRPDVERVAALGRWLDQALPFPGEPINQHFGCSDYAARCALPFALGYRNVLPANRLSTVTQLLVAGDVKQVGYALNFIMGRSSGGRDKRAQAGPEPAAASSSSSESELEDDDPSGEEDDDDPSEPKAAAASPPPFRSLLRTHRASLPRTMQPSLTAAEFHTVVRWLGEETDSLSVMQLLGYELPPYAKRRSKSGAEMIEAGKPYMPRAAGSVLRAYLREVHGQRVDDCEPGVHTMADAVPA